MLRPALVSATIPIAVVTSVDDACNEDGRRATFTVTAYASAPVLCGEPHSYVALVTVQQTQAPTIHRD